MSDKCYIAAQQLLEDSFRLAAQVYDDGFRPDFIIGIWRGGAPIGIAVQEYYDYKGIETDHIAVRTSSYYGIGKQSKEIKVHGLHYIIENANADDSLLIVDDVFDSGRSIYALKEKLSELMRLNLPKDIRTACPQTTVRPQCPYRYPHYLPNRHHLLLRRTLLEDTDILQIQDQHKYQSRHSMRHHTRLHRDYPYRNTT